MTITRILKNKKFYFTIIILLFAGYISYTRFFQTPAKKSDTAKVKFGTLQETMTISGSIDAEERATLRFPTSGRLAFVGVKEGDKVKKYQTIASLDQVSLKKTLEKEMNDYLTARSDLDQAHDTYKSQIMTDSIYRIINGYQQTLNKSVLDVELQKLSVDYANLWSPIDGIVTKVDAPFPGVNTTPTQAEFEILNPNTVYFSATADQSEVVKLKELMKGELILDSYPDTTIKGSIEKISFIPKSGETGTVYEVKFIFPNDNSDYKYRIGMAGDLSFITKEKKKVLYIPDKFITNLNGKKTVTVKRKGKEEKVGVRTGMETDSGTEIISGLSVGETVYD
ncbi:MAG: Efflux transporter, RND family, MFP subunit [Candidatus Gottesmanbacteria bacterium GW2011_GWC2_39_8]|uniref:Efflux transporter, RND family, MFP subunit n=1 Tax=Candidatus Gottesmanbacteria bacterium GW2011_GWC2_39_8 TaxID=1618450 RepID=A0A0G0PUT4_9BACT|nr:MAG: Efflux transporter, RND family, MFP subunit [Candidatus Gottesmanbacteria bacterium GW2011_GWC2_39_8]